MIHALSLLDTLFLPFLEKTNNAMVKMMIQNKRTMTMKRNRNSNAMITLGMITLPSFEKKTASEFLENIRGQIHASGQHPNFVLF
jgi:hypothetical protein